MKPIFNFLFIGLFFVFIFKSIYSLYTLFEAPECDISDICYKSLLNKSPKLDLFVFVSDNSRSGNFEEILYLSNFEYKHEFEKYEINCISFNEIPDLL